ncbi:hypothetical protein ZIOFF_027105 [Zingiber officinale]|uniref:Uncharacterized protein n=1 Tax=Zingiber officinale TaxID=94328 RepID=A0A8J5H5U7_ZINOF|nr:hypothetical protein ZIOFF_027105 [Zingiber officinale]
MWLKLSTCSACPSESAPGFFSQAPVKCMVISLQHPRVEAYWGNSNSIGRLLSSTTLVFRVAMIKVRKTGIFNTYMPQMCIDDGRVVSNFVVQDGKFRAKRVARKGSGMCWIFMPLWKLKREAVRKKTAFWMGYLGMCLLLGCTSYIFSLMCSNPATMYSRKHDGMPLDIVENDEDGQWKIPI